MVSERGTETGCGAYDKDIATGREERRYRIVGVWEGPGLDHRGRRHPMLSEWRRPDPFDGDVLGLAAEDASKLRRRGGAVLVRLEVPPGLLEVYPLRASVPGTPV